MHSSVAGQPVPEELSVVNLASGCAFLAMAVGISAAWVLYRNKSEDVLEQKIPARQPHSLDRSAELRYDSGPISHQCRRNTCSHSYSKIEASW